MSWTAAAEAIIVILPYEVVRSLEGEAWIAWGYSGLWLWLTDAQGRRGVRQSIDAVW